MVQTGKPFQTPAAATGQARSLAIDDRYDQLIRVWMRISVWPLDESSRTDC